LTKFNVRYPDLKEHLFQLGSNAVLGVETLTSVLRESAPPQEPRWYSRSVMTWDRGKASMMIHSHYHSNLTAAALRWDEPDDA